MIQAISGLPGSGKTLYATKLMWELRNSRPSRRIVTNYPLFLPGEPVGFVEEVGDLFDLTSCTVVADELHLWCGARQWKSHGLEFAEWVSQLRKRDVDLWYTTQDMSSVDKLVRDRTAMSYYLESFLQLGVFVWRAYVGSAEKKERFYRWGWYLFDAWVASLYDTNYQVEVGGEHVRRGASASRV